MPAFTWEATGCAALGYRDLKERRITSGTDWMKWLARLTFQDLEPKLADRGISIACLWLRHSPGRLQGQPSDQPRASLQRRRPTLANGASSIPVKVVAGDKPNLVVLVVTVSHISGKKGVECRIARDIAKPYSCGSSAQGL